jgi:hypothetical protein
VVKLVLEFHPKASELLRKKESVTNAIEGHEGKQTETP